MLKFFKIFCLFITLFLGEAHANKSNFVFVDFDKSMEFKDKKKSTEYIYFKNLYKQFNPRAIKSVRKTLIPRVIHQIWLSDEPIPQKYLKLADRWKKMYPKWQYKLWRMEDINKLEFETKDLFNESKSSEEKLEIIKFEILNKSGGVYIDINYIPILNIDYFNNLYKYFGGIEPLADRDKSSLKFSTSFIGSQPNNVVIRKTLETIKNNWQQKKDYKNFTNDIYNKEVKDRIRFINRAIMFPTTYFNITLLDNSIIRFIKNYLLFQKVPYYNRIHKETIAAKKEY